MPPCSPFIDDGSMGEVMVVTTATLPTGGELYAGRLVYNITTGCFHYYDGTNWHQLNVDFICTSSTRPVAPSLHSGLRIFETDTFKVYQYDSVAAAWFHQSPRLIVTNATRPSGLLLHKGLTIFETDTAKSFVYDSVSAAWFNESPPIICTAATRPTGLLLHAGLIIFETDTFKTWQYDGSAWIHLGDRLSCTAATRPTGARLHSGLRIYETDTFRSLYYDGTGWICEQEPLQTYTPSLVQGATPTKTTDSGYYRRHNGMVTFNAHLTLTATGGTAGNGIQIGTPVAIAGVGSFYPLGAGGIYDVSSTIYYPGTVVRVSSTTLGLMGASTGGGLLGQHGFTAALAVGDLVAVSGTGPMNTAYL